MRDTDAMVTTKRLSWIPVLLLAGSAAAAIPESVFTPGERTRYAVKYLGLTTGEAELTVGWKMTQYGHEVWPLVCAGRTTSVGAIFAVNDRFISYWDPQARQAVGADFLADENRKRRRERYRYDFEAGAALTSKQKAGEPAREGRYDIGPGTMDLASATFSLRNQPLAVGSSWELPIFTGTKAYQLKADVVGLEPLETALGTLDVYRVTVNGDFSGKLATRGLMTIFYTADGRRLPVRAEAEFALGTITLEVVSWEPGVRFAGGGL